MDRLKFFKIEVKRRNFEWFKDLFLFINEIANKLKQNSYITVEIKKIAKK